jgi:MFS family permease
MGTIALGVGFLVMAVAPSLAVAVIGASIGGLGNGIQIVAVRTAVQETAPEQWMAMIIGLNESIFTAFPGAGFLLGGAITALAGPRPAFLVGAAGSLAVAAAMRLWLPHEQRLEPAKPVSQTDLTDSGTLPFLGSHPNLSAQEKGLAQLERAKAVQKPAD